MSSKIEWTDHTEILSRFARQILDREGLSEWRIEVGCPPAECINDLEIIRISDTYLEQPLIYAIEVIMHEVAHAKTNTGHNLKFYEELGRLYLRHCGFIDKIMGTNIEQQEKPQMDKEKTNETPDLVESLRSEADILSDNLDSLALHYGERFFNELPPNQMELAFKWAEKWREDPKQISTLIFAHSENTGPEIRFGLAGYWLMKHSPGRS